MVVGLFSFWLAEIDLMFVLSCGRQSWSWRKTQANPHWLVDSL
jgi:hypothetical protein